MLKFNDGDTVLSKKRVFRLPFPKPKNIKEEELDE
jgi:hypothetical protein